jgi:hypothetical protein
MSGQNMREYLNAVLNPPQKKQNLQEKAKSKNQQQAAGMALAAKRGEMPKSELQGAAKEMMSMSKSDLEDYAETEHKGLPDKVSEAGGDDGREWDEEHWDPEMMDEHVPLIGQHITIDHPEEGRLHLEILGVTEHDDMGQPAEYRVMDEDGNEFELWFDEIVMNLEESQRLSEDQGDLDQIDRELQEPFKMFGSGNKKRSITHGKLGRGSPVWEVKPANAMDAWRMMDDMMAQEKPMGMVMRIGGDQVYSVFKREKQRFDQPGYRFAWNTSWWKNQGQETEIGQKLNNFRIDSRADGGENKVLGHIRGIVKAAKEIGEPVDALVVGEDLERAQKRKQRAAQQKGRIDDPSGEKFRRDARQNLMRRLDKYKASKAEQFDSPEEFLEGVKRSGVLDKVNIGGFSYSLQNENLRLDSLLGRDRMGQEAYIDYRLDDYIKAMDHWEQTGERVPDLVTIFFKLDGLQLVPTGVKTGR